MDNKIIGMNIKEYRKKNHLTQAQLAELTNLSAAHIAKLEIGKNHLSINSLLVICNILNVTPNDILFGSFPIQSGDSSDHEFLYENNLNFEQQLVINKLTNVIKQESQNIINTITHHK